MLATHTCAAGGSRRARGVAHDRPNGRGGRLASDARRGGGRQPDSRGPGCSRSRRRSPAAGEGTRAGNTECGWWGGATPRRPSRTCWQLQAIWARWMDSRDVAPGPGGSVRDRGVQL